MTKLDQSIQDATAMRKEEKASNLKSLKEATEGKEALNAAMDVLQSFYESVALVQVRATKLREVKPEFSAGGYSGHSGQNSIIALLKKVAADFAQEASTLQAAEDAAASEFKQFLSDTKSDKKKKEINQQHNVMSMTSEKASLEQRKKDLVSTEKQLSAAMEYYEAGWTTFFGIFELNNIFSFWFRFEFNDIKFKRYSEEIGTLPRRVWSERFAIFPLTWPTSIVKRFLTMFRGGKLIWSSTLLYTLLASYAVQQCKSNVKHFATQTLTAIVRQDVLQQHSIRSPKCSHSLLSYDFHPLDFSPNINGQDL